ncbi:MAG TPA: penicillin acylase family protein [Acidimicrobiales bacterium]|jgi:acyl-homoserine-lactone acylase
MAQQAHRAVAAAVVVALLMATACSGDDDSGDSSEGELVGHGDTYRATIRRSAGGVPHITGDTMTDLTFGQGYASGEDRSCDLADQVVKIRGERARWFGPGQDDENLSSDYAWRSIGIFDRAEQDWEEASPKVQDLLTAFAAGWNAHLDEVGVDGIVGWCQGAEWVRPLEPVEVYAYARAFALYASSVQLADYIAAAQPPGEQPAQPAQPAPSRSTERLPQGVGAFERGVSSLGSNGWAVGSERSEDGGGMLVANPHFPWEGELRFWEVHLTIPGEVNAYGVQLSGLPGIGIGFTEHFGWTHTVSAGNRFTAYRLQLVPGDPTSYMYGGEPRHMTKKDITIDVLGAGGEVEHQTRTMWSSHYGPIIDVRAVQDIPQLGWTTDTALTYRDANYDNDEILDQYLAMVEAQDFDQFVEAFDTYAGIPLFNTLAVSDDGRAWYADYSATPNLSDAALAGFEALKQSDIIVKMGAEQGLVLLDGSDPLYEWEEAEGARDPGLVPPDEMPQVERDDYVFNANDSFWMPHASEMLEGDYSPLHGPQRTARSPRTRENATVLDDTTPEGPAGEDGKFTLDELGDAALRNQGYLARELLDDVVQRCTATPTVDVPELPASGDADDGLSAGHVDLAKACQVLDGWDGIYDLDRAGPPLWREMLSQFSFSDQEAAGKLWAEPFDPTRPLETPGGLAPVGPDGVDPVLQNLGRAVQILEAAGVPVDATLGDLQFAVRGDEHVPVHGGGFWDGTTNVVGSGGRGASVTTRDPDIPTFEDGVFAPRSTLAEVDGEPAYPVDFGTSFLLALHFTDDGPEAKAFLTYGDTSDRSSADYVEATQRFSDKNWRDVLFRPAAVKDAAITTTTVRG